ncbi:hypothetical protein T281_07330 [Rhodomicrobium udaipurense JA643]|jgi:flagellar motor switch protein FliM|uniref:Flagellar motor switch protein FliM n=1 Tax=Rhodomicrobium udaipurense TaxID=1202716 RepID=A0A8I1GEW3_9HYPH|nr:FliM/FliN family flagellar motor switch protein [Rhodomicrobium udaipurense]KAI95126.1 hypothetical protein T281_07330 [Rhodomicrobium udaipurense JA643]MBJ7541985.1 FliM/FliN family flagellar motor switch protein [Rhodomicrobium udaipurense]
MASQSPDAAAGAGVEIIDKLKELSKLSLDRLPVLTSIFEGMALSCCDEFREYCSPAVTAFVNQIVSGDSWDLLEACSDGVSVIFYCREWDARIVIGVERRLIFSIVDAMYGGDGSELPYEDKRSFTALETKIGRVICEFGARSFTESFRTVGEITLAPERTETALDFASLGQHNMMLIHAQILFQVLDVGGVMFVLIPQNVLLPVRQKLERQRAPMLSSVDPRWTSLLSQRVSRAEVSMDAVILGKEIELGQMLKLEVGKTLELEGTERNIFFEYEGDRLFRGCLGRERGTYTVTIDEALSDIDVEETESRHRS